MDLEEIEIKEAIQAFGDLCYDIHQFVMCVDFSLLDGEGRNLFEVFDDLFKINNVSFVTEHDDITEPNMRANILYDELMSVFGTLQFLNLHSGKVDCNRFHDVDEQGALYDIYTTVEDFLEEGQL